MPDDGRDLIPEEADDPGSGQCPQVRQLLRVDEALDRLVERDTGADEDGGDDEQPRELLAAEAAHEEGNPERDRRRGVAEVVDQVCEQRHRTREDEDGKLEQRRHDEHRQADRDRLDACARADDRRVDEPVRVAVPTVSVIAVSVVMPIVVMTVFVDMLDCLKRP